MPSWVKSHFLICGCLEVNDRLLCFYIKHCVMTTEWHDLREINSLYRDSYWAYSPQPWHDHGMRVLFHNHFLFLFYKADITAIRKLIFCRLEVTFDMGMTNLINTLFMHVTISLVHSESISEVSQKRMEKKLIVKCFKRLQLFMDFICYFIFLLCTVV